MPYTNTLTGDFGLGIDAVRADSPNASIPDGADYGDWRWYEPAPHTADGQLTVAIEQPPLEVNGVLTQQWVVQPAPLESRIHAFERALDAHLDAVARERRYTDRVTCALRAGYPGPFQAEGQAFAVWMDTCNALAYQMLSEVVAGQRELPDSTQALIDLLPAMEWPA